jgi:hypothetical protein
MILSLETPWSDRELLAHADTYGILRGCDALVGVLVDLRTAGKKATILLPNPVRRRAALRLEPLRRHR